MTWWGWETRGGGPFQVERPGALAWGVNLMGAFVVASDHTLRQHWWNGTEWAWINHGGSCALGQAPSVVSWNARRVDIFVLDTEQRLQQRTWIEGAGWQWYSIGGDPGIGSTHAVSWGSGRIDLFYTGPDSSLRHRWSDSNFDGGNWQSANHGGNLMGIAPVCWGPNRIDVFCIDGVTRLMKQRSWNGSSWGWYPVAGGPYQGYYLGAASWGPNRLDVFAVKISDGSLDQIAWDGGNWRTANHGGSSISAPSVVARAPNRLDVLLLKNDYSLHRRFWDGSNWTWDNLGGRFHPAGAGAAPSSPAAISWGPSRLDVFCIGEDGALWHNGGDGALAVPEGPQPPGPSNPPPTTDTRGTFSFILNGDWTTFITPAQDEVYVAARPPGAASATHHAMARGVNGWQVSVPVAGAPGVWTFTFHVRGTYGDGSDTGDINSPDYTYDWEVRSPAAYVTLDSQGSGDGDWSSFNVVNS